MRDISDRSSGSGRRLAPAPITPPTDLTPGPTLTNIQLERDEADGTAAVSVTGWVWGQAA